MKFAVFGGTGLIGSRVVEKLTAAGYEALPQSRSTGVDVVTGRGVAEAVAGVDVIIDVTSSPTYDAAAANFFRTSMTHLVDAAENGRVRHIVMLSIIGIDRLPDVAYYQAKLLQERILAAGSIPYSIVRAAQFMEFVEEILSWTTDGDTVRLPTTPIQPIAADDVADALIEVAAGAPLQGIRNVAGPEAFALDELGRITLRQRGDARTVVTDSTAGLYAAVDGDALTDDKAQIAPTRYLDWLAATPKPRR